MPSPHLISYPGTITVIYDPGTSLLYVASGSGGGGCNTGTMATLTTWNSTAFLGGAGGTSAFWYNSTSSTTVANNFFTNETGILPIYIQNNYVPARPAIHRSDRVDHWKQRQAKAVIALEKSYSLYRALRGRSELERFLAGEKIMIKGVLFDYGITKKDDPLSHTRALTNGHIPYQLELYNKRGFRVANGCVVIRDTPVMDQIIAVVSHLNNIEEELQLLRITNWEPPDAVHRFLENYRR